MNIESIPKNYQSILKNYFYEKKSSESTKKSYTKEIIAFYNYNNKKIEEVKNDDCKEYIKKIENEASQKKISISTAEKIYSILYTIFKFATKNRQKYNLPNEFENYFDRIQKPKANKEIKYENIISFGEIDKLISYFKENSIRDYAIFSLIFTSALTRTEISELKWNQFFEDAKGNIGIEYNLPYGNKRFVPITKDTWELLIEYRKKTLSSDSEFVFQSRKSKSISINRIDAMIKKACINAGLKKTYTPTQIRQSAIAYALKNNIEPSALIEQTNWSDLRPVKRYNTVINNLDKGIGTYINFEIKHENKQGVFNGK